MLDKVVAVRLSANVKAKCERARRKLDSVKAKEKDEEKAIKAALLLREEVRKFQERLKSLPIAEQQKIEEKKR